MHTYPHTYKTYKLKKKTGSYKTDKQRRTHKLLHTRIHIYTHLDTQTVIQTETHKHTLRQIG